MHGLGAIDQGSLPWTQRAPLQGGGTFPRLTGQRPVSMTVAGAGTGSRPLWFLRFGVVLFILFGFGRGEKTEIFMSYVKHLLVRSH